MKKIGIISDTHFATLAEGVALVERLRRSCFANVDAVIHCGDLVHPDTPLLFDDWPFYVVRGNMDIDSPHIPEQRILQLEGFNIAVIHGWGNAATLEQRLLNHFDGVSLDCLVYGHSHLPVCHRVGKLLVMNPGSAADRRCAPWHSVGILTLDESLYGEIINIDDNGQID